MRMHFVRNGLQSEHLPSHNRLRRSLRGRQNRMAHVIDCDAVFVDVRIAWLRQKVWRLSALHPGVGLLVPRSPPCFHAPRLLLRWMPWPCCSKSEIPREIAAKKQQFSNPDLFWRAEKNSTLFHLPSRLL